MAKKTKPPHSLVEQLSACNDRIATLTVRITHAKLMGYADKVTELRRRLDRAERHREKIRRKLHKS